MTGKSRRGTRRKPGVRPIALIGESGTCGRPGELETDDIARTQRQAFISAYETRKNSDSIFSLGRQMLLPRQVIVRWLQDPTFQQALVTADAWRVALVRDIFSRGIGAVAENLMEIAKERWPHSVTAGIAILKLWLNMPDEGAPQLHAVQIGQVNVFGDKPTEDQLTELLAQKARNDRILRKYLKGVEVPAEIVGFESGPGRPRGRRKRDPRGPGPVPEGGTPPGA